MRKLLALTAVITLLAGCGLAKQTEEAPAVVPTAEPEVATPDVPDVPDVPAESAESAESVTPTEPETPSVDDGTPSIPNDEVVPVNADLPAPTAE